MISRTTFCSTWRCPLISGSKHTDARHLAKPIGFSLDDVEDLLTERLDHLLGVDWPDASDHPGVEMFSVCRPVDSTLKS